MPLRGDYKKDVEDVKETAIKMLTREYSSAQKEFHLINGYRRVDPRRGAEYILDIGIKNTGNDQDTTIRCDSMLQYKKILTTIRRKRSFHVWHQLFSSRPFLQQGNKESFIVCYLQEAVCV